jgi:RimJ/RimL family protein N-acetyltransferase
MATKEELIYRQVITLRDGARVLLRPLIQADRQALLDLFGQTTNEERQLMRHNINDPQVVEGWAEKIDYEQVFPLVAVVNDRIVGNATLHFFEGHARHRGEVRIFLAKDFRQRGLGTKMMQALIEIARRRSLYILEIQILAEQVNDIKAMRKAGFEVKCTFEDYYMLPDGELRDIVHMILPLHISEGEF